MLEITKEGIPLTEIGFIVGGLALYGLYGLLRFGKLSFFCYILQKISPRCQVSLALPFPWNLTRFFPLLL